MNNCRVLAEFNIFNKSVEVYSSLNKLNISNFAIKVFFPHTDSLLTENVSLSIKYQMNVTI